VRIARNLKEMINGTAYDHAILCNHSNESYGLPQVDNFQNIDLNNKSLLIFFSGTDDLSTFIQKDDKSKWQLEETL
jgi:hypothetical protein